MVNEQEFYLFGQIQTSQTGGQPYSDTFPTTCFVTYNSLAWRNFVWQPDRACA